MHDNKTQLCVSVAWGLTANIATDFDFRVENLVEDLEANKAKHLCGTSQYR